MRILLSTFGSRGDVEPMAALGAALQSVGADAAVCAPSDQEFASLLARANVPLAPAFTPIRQWAADAMANRPPMSLEDRAKLVLAAQYDAILTAARDSDIIVATGLFPSTAAAYCVAEKLGIPYVYATFCPIWLPSEHHPPFEYPAKSRPEGITDNRALWDHDIGTMNALFGEAMNAHRRKIGQAPLENVRDAIFTRTPWLASDPTLSPWRPTDLCDVTQTGAWLLPDHRPLPGEVEAFLQSGAPPIYVGFGSMPMESLRQAVPSAVEAARAHGRRVILAHGWAELSLPDDQSDCHAVGDINQQALFPRMAAIVHHGGAGTTTTASRSGIPQVVVPQIADQPYFARRVATLGIGVAHAGSTPTFDSMNEALALALSDATIARAAEVAQALRTDGALQTARCVISYSSITRTASRSS